MKWRCPQCGKPHERNDPPCDNCGHHKFERAVVPAATVDEDHEQFVWACTECGRHHQRNNPPCSRCGGTTFEKKPLNYDDFDAGGTSSYLDLVGPFEVGAALVVVALVTIGALGYLGVVHVPGITPRGHPTVENVPGNGTTVGDLALADVETSTLNALNDQRSSTLERTGGLDTLATYADRRLVKDTYTNADRGLDKKQLRRFDVRCSGRTYVRSAMTGPVSADTTAQSLAAAVVAQLQGGSVAPTDSSIERIGIDAHAGPDDRVFVVVAYC
ncbi:MAG: hypothetical protein ABEI57_08190 [Halapricum sp.]